MVDTSISIRGAQASQLQPSVPCPKLRRLEQRVVCLAIGLAMVAGCQPTDPVAMPTEKNTTFIIVGDTAGWIVPCGCSTSQSGGLSRRASLVDSYAKTDHTMLLDVGGAASGQSEYHQEKLLAILQGERAMNVAAHNLGASESRLGAERLRELMSRSDVPFISANLRDPNGQEIASAYRMVERGPDRFAIIGVIEPELADRQLKTVDAYQAILDTLKKIPEPVTGRLVLAYGEREFLEELTRLLPEVDAVIGGPTGQPIPPQRVGGRWLASSTNKGKFAVVVRHERSQKDWACEIQEIGEHWPDHPAQVANLHAFYSRLQAQDFEARETELTTVVWPEHPNSATSSELALRFVGNANCATCHQADSQHWEGTKHAIAWHTLVEKRAHVDSYCQQCHTIGFGQAGGFSSIGRTPQMTAVGCENCHGPGSLHAANPRLKMPVSARDACVHCHDRENSPNFDYSTYWAKIVHGVKLDGAGIDATPDK